MKLLLLVLIALVMDSCQQTRGDQILAVEQDKDVVDRTMDEDYLDEDIQEMTLDNTQLGTGGDALERINEEEVDDEIISAERHESYPVWKILLVVGGSAAGLGLLVTALILVLKSRNNTKAKEVKTGLEASVPKDDVAVA